MVRRTESTGQPPLPQGGSGIRGADEAAGFSEVKLDGKWEEDGRYRQITFLMNSRNNISKATMKIWDTQASPRPLILTQYFPNLVDEVIARDLLYAAENPMREFSRNFGLGVENPKEVTESIEVRVSGEEHTGTVKKRKLKGGKEKVEVIAPNTSSLGKFVPPKHNLRNLNFNTVVVQGPPQHWNESSPVSSDAESQPTPPATPSPAHSARSSFRRSVSTGSLTAMAAEAGASAADASAAPAAAATPPAGTRRFAAMRKKSVEGQLASQRQRSSSTAESGAPPSSKRASSRTQQAALAMSVVEQAQSAGIKTADEMREQIMRSVKIIERRLLQITRQTQSEQKATQYDRELEGHEGQKGQYVILEELLRDFAYDPSGRLKTIESLQPYWESFSKDMLSIAHFIKERDEKVGLPGSPTMLKQKFEPIVAVYKLQRLTERMAKKETITDEEFADVETVLREFVYNKAGELQVRITNQPDLLSLGPHLIALAEQLNDNENPAAIRLNTLINPLLVIHTLQHATAQIKAGVYTTPEQFSEAVIPAEQRLRAYAYNKYKGLKLSTQELLNLNNAVTNLQDSLKKNGHLLDTTEENIVTKLNQLLTLLKSEISLVRRRFLQQEVHKEFVETENTFLERAKGIPEKIAELIATATPLNILDTGDLTSLNALVASVTSGLETIGQLHRVMTGTEGDQTPIRRLLSAFRDNEGAITEMLARYYNDLEKNTAQMVGVATIGGKIEAELKRVAKEIEDGKETPQLLERRGQLNKLNQLVRESSPICYMQRATKLPLLFKELLGRTDDAYERECIEAIANWLKPRAMYFNNAQANINLFDLIEMIESGQPEEVIVKEMLDLGNYILYQPSGITPEDRVMNEQKRLVAQIVPFFEATIPEAQRSEISRLRDITTTSKNEKGEGSPEFDKARKQSSEFERYIVLEAKADRLLNAIRTTTGSTKNLIVELKKYAEEKMEPALMAYLKEHQDVPGAVQEEMFTLLDQYKDPTAPPVPRARSASQQATPTPTSRPTAADLVEPQPTVADVGVTSPRQRKFSTLRQQTKTLHRRGVSEAAISELAASTASAEALSTRMESITLANDLKSFAEKIKRGSFRSPDDLNEELRSWSQKLAEIFFNKGGGLKISDQDLTIIRPGLESLRQQIQNKNLVAAFPLCEMIEPLIVAGELLGFANLVRIEGEIGRSEFEEIESKLRKACFDTNNELTIAPEKLISLWGAVETLNSVLGQKRLRDSGKAGEALGALYTDITKQMAPGFPQALEIVIGEIAFLESAEKSLVFYRKLFRDSQEPAFQRIVMALEEGLPAIRAFSNSINVNKGLFEGVLTAYHPQSEILHRYLAAMKRLAEVYEKNFNPKARRIKEMINTNPEITDAERQTSTGEINLSIFFQRMGRHQPLLQDLFKAISKSTDEYLKAELQVRLGYIRKVLSLSEEIAFIDEIKGLEGRALKDTINRNLNRIPAVLENPKMPADLKEKVSVLYKTGVEELIANMARMADNTLGATVKEMVNVIPDVLNHLKTGNLYNRVNTAYQTLMKGFNIYHLSLGAQEAINQFEAEMLA